VDLSLLKRTTNQTISRAQKVLGEVRNISVVIEEKAKSDVQKIRVKINKLLGQREKIELEIKQLNQSIGTKIDEFKIALQKQKDRIQNQLKSISNSATQTRLEFQNEIKRLGHVLNEFDSSVSLDKSSILELTTSTSTTASYDSNASPEDTKSTVLLPQVRGLGDGYGRHL